MAQKKTSNNTVIRYPDALTVSARDAGGGALGAFDDADDALGPDYPEGLVACLHADAMQIVEVIEIGGGLALGAFDDVQREAQDIELRVALADGESAVVLNQSDGVFAWEFAHTVADGGDASLGFDADDTPRCAFFKQRYEARVDPDADAGALGFDAGVILQPFKKLVLRFAGKKTLESLSAFVERNIVEGPVVVGERQWTPVADLSAQPPPAKPILLLVHGTFSNTLGSFGDLTGSVEGQDFLAAARRRYALILGYDHKTLTKTVADNAGDILAALRRLPGDQPLVIDAIGFSRGGLVLRYLNRMLLAADRRIVLRAVTFVGSANAGTVLAEPDNWEALVNFYTNLVIASSRIAQLIAGPPLVPAARIIEGALTGLLSFVRFLADVTITDRALPGLASMEPDGREVRAINAATGPADTATCYAITADFGHRFFADGNEANGLKKRFALEAFDQLSDRLMKQSNDLVVNRSSMTQLDPRHPDGLTARHDYPSDSGVYHTVYFKQPTTALRLTQWLLA